jgi:hypothetical protein
MYQHSGSPRFDNWFITTGLLLVVLVSLLAGCDRTPKLKVDPSVVLTTEERAWVHNCAPHPVRTGSFAVADCIERAVALRGIR